ncbi:YrbL family protein [Thalassorhabdomicrobium marinisediminis]|uniref:YrbL family protein n=1 Tax=Thalassorhabdomicrobium marinisediminis TaxID=2170577 RepID=UPI0024913C6C|nr:YrbL family protein [Thalassorhabdomicrobium marinisediminis]
MTARDVIVLAGSTPLARGFEREVHAHPTEPDRLLKVLVPAEHQGGGGRARRFFAARGPKFRDFLIAREYREYARAALSLPQIGARLPITHMFGFQDTDLGLACVTERVSDEAGALAPTLDALSRGGALSDDQIAALTDFAQRLLRYDIRCSDLTRKNIALGYRAGPTRRGPFEAVLVDGFGDTHAIAVRTVSRRVNAASVHRKLGRIAEKSGLVWDTTGEVFTR